VGRRACPTSADDCSNGCTSVLARIDGRDIKLLTRTGLYWSHRYRATVQALGKLEAKSVYIDGELCAHRSA